MLEKDVTVKTSLGTFLGEQSGCIVGTLLHPWVCMCRGTFKDDKDTLGLLCC